MTKIYDVRIPEKVRETRTIRVSLGTLIDIEAASREASDRHRIKGANHTAKEYNMLANELARLRLEEKE